MDALHSVFSALTSRSGCPWLGRAGCARKPVLAGAGLFLFGVAWRRSRDAAWRKAFEHVGRAAGVGWAYLTFPATLRANCDPATAAAALPPDAFRGKVVWVTGASSGIGRELCAQLAFQGATLILSSRRAATLDALAAELDPVLRATGGAAAVVPLDLGDLDALPGRAAAALAAFGRVDVLVNNGGTSQRALGRFCAFDVDRAMTDVDYLSCVLLAKAVLPTMRARGGGTIVTISSLAGKCGLPLRTAYCGAKHALQGFFDALRAEEALFPADNIRVVTICPGSVKTDVARNAASAGGGHLGRSDPNIDGGLSVGFCCDRILAAAHAGLDESWIALPHELAFAYENTYRPAPLRALLAKNALAMATKTMGSDAFLRGA